MYAGKTVLSFRGISCKYFIKTHKTMMEQNLLNCTFMVDFADKNECFRICGANESRNVTNTGSFFTGTWKAILPLQVNGGYLLVFCNRIHPLRIVSCIESFCNISQVME